MFRKCISARFCFGFTRPDGKNFGRVAIFISEAGEPRPPLHQAEECPARVDRNGRLTFFQWDNGDDENFFYAAYGGQTCQKKLSIGIPEF
jgi:hypothetical protein